MKKTNLVLGFMLIMLFAMSTNLMAATTTTYVNYTTGNDGTGNGSSGSPYKTFHKGYTETIAGNTIDLTGTFNWTNTDETDDVSTTGYTIGKNLTIQGQVAEQTFVQAHSNENSADRRVFTISSGTTVTIKDMSIKNGNVGGSHGGGIYNDGTLTLTNCTVSGNSASVGGGGISTGESGTLTLTNCTVSENSANYGGGISGIAGIVSGTLTLTNCTISGNTTVYGGGGIINYNTLTITNCTVSGNTAGNTAGGGISASSSTLYIKNTILANNIGQVSDQDFYNNGSTVNDNGYNIVEFSTGYTFSATGDITGNQVNLNLDNTLRDNNTTNGTQTLKTTSGSVAINAGATGTNGLVSVPTTDQRGANRNGATDIGAYEYYDNDASLPVELTSFTATQKNNTVILEWQTGSEQDNLGFIIERKETNNEFIEIASYANNEELKGAGNTSARSDYTFTDNNVVSGVTYKYRISDVDYSGKVKILKTITINITENSTDIPKTYALNSAYPNPFNPTTTISYDLPNSSFVTISVYDITGNLVENLINENKEAGSYSIKWNASNISSGIYLYRLVTNDFVSTKKLVLLK